MLKQSIFTYYFLLKTEIKVYSTIIVTPNNVYNLIFFFPYRKLFDKEKKLKSEFLDSFVKFNFISWKKTKLTTSHG